MASEQINNKPDCVPSAQTETVPESGHKGEPETRAVAAEGQGQAGGAVGAVGGESGQDTGREGQGRQKSIEEEEKERADREVSETIKKLDSVLLEVGVKEGQIEGEGADRGASEPKEQATESGGEISVQVPGGETPAQVTAGETAAQVTAGETAAQVTAGETAAQVTAGETAAQVTGEETAAQVTGGETPAQVPGGETPAQVPGGETPAQVTGEETAAQVTGEETAAQVTGEETAAQVTGEETAAQVPGGETAVQVPGEETAAQVTGEETAAQVTGEETAAQVTVGETAAQVTAGETAAQVTAGETAAQVTAGGNAAQVTAEGSPAQVTAEGSPAQVTAEGSPVQVTGGETPAQVTPEGTPAQVTGGETPAEVTVEETPAQLLEGSGTVTKAEEEWIDTLVKNIVTEVTAEDTSAGVVEADSSSQLTEEGGHSCAVVTIIHEQVTTIHEQVTLEPGAGAQTSQVSGDNIDITVQEGELTGRQQVGLSTTEGVTGSVKEQETASVVEADGQVKASGEEALGEVTPDLVTVPIREGTADPGHPAACREKEWPPLICTGSEVRADTAEQRHTQQGTVPDEEQCPGEPDMKDREMVEDEVVLTPETPIEREIRLAMEREMMLRQERGINTPVGDSELVEVRRKTVAVEPTPLPGKERKFAGAQMQREIQLETRREQDLVEQGTLIGLYDRGPQQELQEKKMLFESMNTEPSNSPLKRRQSEMQKSGSVEALVEVPEPSNHVFVEAPVAPAAPAADAKKGPSYAEANGSNIIIIEHASILRKSAPANASSPASLQRSSPAQSRRSTPADLHFGRSSSGDSPLPNSEFSAAAPGSPFQVIRSPSPRSLLEREIEEVQERERELRRQRTSIYGRENGAEENAENSEMTPDNRGDIQSGVYQPERPNWGKLEVNWPPNKSASVNGQQDQALDSPRTRRQRSNLFKSWESGNPNPADDN